MGKNARRRRGADEGHSEQGSLSRAESRGAVRTDRGGGRRFFERYRNLLIGAAAAVGMGLVGYMAFSSATASAYTCGSLLEAPPSQVDGGVLGFPTLADGARHSQRSIGYAECPPTSGEHRGAGALVRDFYGPGKAQIPNDWVHNLEHGYAIIAYSGEPDRDTLDAIRDAMDAAAPSEVALSCGLPNKVIALRFDDMSTPYAVLAWQWALLLDEFDAERITTAATQFQDRPSVPERAC